MDFKQFVELFFNLNVLLKLVSVFSGQLDIFPSQKVKERETALYSHLFYKLKMFCTALPVSCQV